MRQATTATVLLGREAQRRIGIGLVMTAALIWWLGRYTDVDLALADAAFDFHAHAFPWRDAWLANRFNHVILKWVMMAAAVFWIGRAGLDAIAPVPSRAALDRLRMRIVALCAICVPLVVSLLKQASSSHCPWDLDRYGGVQPYVHLLEALPPGVSPGHCLPAGHASSALWLISMSVYWLPGRASVALTAVLLAILPGVAMGVGQQLRGAHFLTHTLWSIWVACVVLLLVTVILQGRDCRGYAGPNRDN